MIIDSNNNVNTSTPASTRTRQSAETGRAAPSSPATPAKDTRESDSVSLSAKAQTMGRLEAEMANAPEIDQSKVDAIKAAISEGRYRVDSQTIADRMLAQDKLLG